LPFLGRDYSPDLPAKRSIPTGIAVILLILLIAWQFAGEQLISTIALAVLGLALAAFCRQTR
jgi:hypothetical protein